MSKTQIEAAPPCNLFLFGANGDLVKRLLMPALYNLSRDGLLDKGLRIIGPASRLTTPATGQRLPVSR